MICRYLGAFGVRLYICGCHSFNTTRLEGGGGGVDRLSGAAAARLWFHWPFDVRPDCRPLDHHRLVARLTYLAIDPFPSPWKTPKKGSKELMWVVQPLGMDSLAWFFSLEKLGMKTEVLKSAKKKLLGFHIENGLHHCFLFVGVWSASKPFLLLSADIISVQDNCLVNFVYCLPVLRRCGFSIWRTESAAFSRINIKASTFFFFFLSSVFYVCFKFAVGRTGNLFHGGED